MSVARELFRYDVARHVISTTPWLQSLVYARLQPEGVEELPSGPLERGAAGEKNQLLREYVDRLVAEPSRRLQELQEYFGRESIPFDPYITRKSYGVEKKSQQYFSDLAGPRLKNAYLLIDPISGIRVQGQADVRYVSLVDLKSLHGRLGEDGILAAFHRKPQGRSWKDDIIEKNQYLITFSRYIAYVYDSEHCIIHMLRSQPQLSAIKAALQSYRDRYSSIQVEFV
ncbi:MAG: hypothetical protein K1X75_05540 [Leptospirales bacterium]|nr:hypothetical protein [Leptospirales bacterium]